MSGMFDDASESEDEDAQISVVPSPAVAAGLPVHGSTTQQPAKERCHIMGPQLSLPEQAGTAEPPLLCSDDEAVEDDGDLSDGENIDDVLADVDWNLGSATGRYKTILGGQMNSNASRVHSKTYDDPNFQPIERSKLFSKIAVGRIDENTDEHLSKRVNQSVRAIVASDDKERVRKKDKADRATVEQVIDPRTRMILFKLLKNDYIQEIYGTISTGKEANVYHSVAGLTLDEVGNRKTQGFVSKAAVGRAERKAARAAQAAEHLDDEALMMQARLAQAARLQKIADGTAEPEPEPEPELELQSAEELAAATQKEQEDAEDRDRKSQASSARARAFLNGEVSVVRMKTEGGGEPGTGRDGDSNPNDDDEDIGQYMPEIAIKIFKTSILVFKDRVSSTSRRWRSASKHHVGLKPEWFCA
jgi:serine/threonine-protein kinase RIO1